MIGMEKIYSMKYYILMQKKNYLQTMYSLVVFWDTYESGSSPVTPGLTDSQIIESLPYLNRTDNNLAN